MAQDLCMTEELQQGLGVLSVFLLPPSRCFLVPAGVIYETVEMFLWTSSCFRSLVPVSFGAPFRPPPPTLNPTPPFLFFSFVSELMPGFQSLNYHSS